MLLELWRHASEIASRDFIPGFAGYWLHVTNQRGWSKLLRRKGGH